MTGNNLIDQTDALLRAIGHTVVRFQQVEHRDLVSGLSFMYFTLLLRIQNSPIGSKKHS